jgi:anti-anti-sigma regulatory factor
MPAGVWDWALTCEGLLTVHVSWSETVVIVEMRGSVDAHTVEILCTAFDLILARRPGRVVVDSSEVTSWSVRGLDALVGAADHALRSGTALAVAGFGPVHRQTIGRRWPQADLDGIVHASVGEALLAVCARPQPRLGVLVRRGGPR